MSVNNSSSVYITTTLPYVNSNPHVGFALEIVQADMLARAYRAQGRDVFFNTGTDEHGQKIADAAKKEGKDVQEYVDYFAGEFKKLTDLLNLSPDNFIRTTDEHHIAAAQELWRRAEANGDIYKKKYKGLYCVGCEAFMKESDLVDGKCPHHLGKQLEEVEEENYFFKLSNYKDELREYLECKESIVPDYRRREAIATLDALEDISISRSRERLSWGVPVPGDDTQVMYVWFDALTNYISTLGWPCCTTPGVHEGGCKFERFWEQGRTMQVAGKDQVKFQSLIWQGMLLSVGIKNTDTVFYHGFITSDGQKMSKSIGNVIAPSELVDRYGVDATRYILLRHVHPTDDSDLTWERMDEWYTAHLVNGLGNLTARVMKMAETHLDKSAVQGGSLKRSEATGKGVSLAQPVNSLLSEYTHALEDFEFNKALDLVWRLVGEADQIITDTEPFKLVKTDKPAAQEILRDLVGRLAEIAHLLEPAMPKTAKIIQKAITENKKPENLFSRL